MARAKLLGLIAVVLFGVACGGEQRQELRVTGGQLTIQPALLDLGSVALGKEAKQTVTLRNDGIAPMKIDMPEQLLPAGVVGGAPSGLDFGVAGLPISLRAGESRKVEVTFHPAGLGARGLQLPFRTDSSLAPEVPVSVSGQGVLGLAQLSVGQLDFGDIVVGQSVSLTLTLVNNDKATTDVHLSGLTGDGVQAFSVDAPEGTSTLRPDEQLQVNFKFAPSKLGVWRASLDVTPCPTCAVRTVQLTGAGAVRLVDVEPAALDFGDVIAGTIAQGRFTLINRAKKPVTISALATTGNAQMKVELDARTLPVTLAPDERVSGTATFTADDFGLRAGKLSFTASDGAAPELAVTGFGFGAQVNATPKSLNNFAAAVGTTRPAFITLTNTGLDPKSIRPLVVTAATLEGPDAAAWKLSLPTLPWTLGEPGAQGRIDLTYTPAVAGRSPTMLVLTTNDAARPVLKVPLNALARDLQACQARVLPSPVDFGNVGLGASPTSGFEVFNDGADDCILGDPAITSGGPAFHWPGYVVPSGRTIPPGGRASIRVQFTPDKQADFVGEVELYVSNVGSPKITVPLRGHGNSDCFSVIPATIDFGGAPSGCGARTLSATLRNHCAAPVTVDSLAVSQQFGLGASVPTGAFTIQPGQNFDVPVTYDPQTAGDDVGQLTIVSSASPRAHAIGLTGGALAGDSRTDEFDQSTPKVDLLFVVDNSGSTSEEQNAVAANLDQLWSRIALANADFHIAVTTTGMYPYTAGWSQCPGGAQGGEGGRFFPTDGSRPRILTPQTPNVKNELIASMNVGQCHWDERFTEPVIAALTPPLSTSTAPDGNAGFLRDDARLALLAISDADDSADEVNPPSVQSFIDQLRQIKHGALDLVSFSGIVALTACPTIEGLGVRYGEIAKKLGGHLEDICDLNNMGKMLDRSLDNLLAPLSSFQLTSAPRDAAHITVLVDGKPVTDFSYDAAANRVVFAQASIPAPGAHIAVTYETACP